MWRVRFRASQHSEGHGTSTYAGGQRACRSEAPLRYSILNCWQICYLNHAVFMLWDDVGAFEMIMHCRHAVFSSCLGVATYIFLTSDTQVALTPTAAARVLNVLRRCVE